MPTKWCGCGIEGSCTEKTCMVLPDGAKCSDCVHVLRCVTLFGAQLSSTRCDFYPRRFQQIRDAEKAGAT